MFYELKAALGAFYFNNEKRGANVELSHSRHVILSGQDMKCRWLSHVNPLLSLKVVKCKTKFFLDFFLTVGFALVTVAFTSFFGGFCFSMELSVIKKRFRPLREMKKKILKGCCIGV